VNSSVRPSWYSRPCLFPIIFLALFFAGPAMATISYEISLEHPSQHLFHVTMTIPDVHGDILLQMPAWNALYEIRDFSSRVGHVEAFAGSQPLGIAKLDKLTWRVRADGMVTVRYPIYWDTAGPFASQLNEEHAFINPAMALMYLPDRRKEDVSVVFRDVPPGWRVDSPLLVSATDAMSLSPILAPNYDALADAPLEFGTFSEFVLPGISPQIRVLTHGDGWKHPEVENTLSKICKYEIELMGGAPFARYLFIYHLGKAAMGTGGGMEHANATAINSGTGVQAAGVSAHEFFHLWNVKRIRPASLEPIDYTREQFTRALWFAEGVTSTYGSYTLLRSGIWSKQEFYDDLARAIAELESRPANRWQSAEQSSLDTWLGKYDYYNGLEFSVSYYTKGQVLGVLLDILVRDRTDGARSLDDVLRRMNEEFARKGQTYRDSLDVRLTAESVAGGSFADFFDKYVANAEPLPYQSVLAKAGLLLRKQDIVRAQLGFSYERDASGQFIVRAVEPGSTAEGAGLRAGDELKKWNGENIPPRPERRLRNKKPGEALQLQLLRDGQPLDLTFELGGVATSTFVIVEDPQASPKARALRDGLLTGKPGAAAVAAAPWH
jgi:predicted metalloprotease with PDZ domain